MHDSREEPALQLTRRWRDGPGSFPARFVTLAFVLVLPTCSRGGSTDGAREETGMKPTIEQVLVQRTPELMRMDGVTGVGQALCEGEPCIRVYVTVDSAAQRIPPTLDGYPVSVVVTGMMRPRHPG